MSTATAGYRELIATQIARHPEQDAQALASRIAGMIPGDDLRDCARAYVRYEIDGYRRARAREAETRAAEAAHQERRLAREREWAERQEREKLEAERRDAAYRQRAAEREAEERARLDEDERYLTSAEFHRRLEETPGEALMEMKAIDKRDHFQYHRGWWSVGIAFREHCGDQLGAWLKRAEAELSAAEQREREEHQRERDLSFWCDRHQKHECTQAGEWSWNKEHCHNKPVYGGKCRRHGGVPVEPPSTIGNWGLYGAFYPGGYLGKATDDLIADVAAKTRLEVTRELLGTVFALGDGTSVTWGLATIEQHEQRIAMLSANAAGVVETASRHAAAVRMIRDAGAACLADLAAA